MIHYQRIDLNRIKTYSIKGRRSKNQIKNFGKPVSPDYDVTSFLGSLPKYLKADDFRKLLNSIAKAKRRGKPIIFMCGAHVIKCGLSPVLIDLMQNGFVSLLATNGAGAIHDFEIALWGKTSEEVERSIQDGSFGMAKETAEIFNQVSLLAQKENGFGRGNR
jgi:deoxyhypusine synthase